MKEFVLEFIHHKRGEQFYRTFKVSAKTGAGAKRKLKKHFPGAKLSHVEVV